MFQSKRRILGVTAAVAFAVTALAAPASAGAGGVPNENADCHAQWLRWYQRGDDGLAGGSVKDVADAYGLTVKQVQENLKAYCDAGGALPPA